MPLNLDQSAVGADGTLLDAKDITWFHDADDDTPLPSASRTPFQSPAVIVAGSRRSVRVPRPASKLTNPNNVVLGRRKAAHQVVICENEVEDAVAEIPEWDDDEDTHTDNADIDDTTPSKYQQTKKMGDAADRRGRSFCGINTIARFRRIPDILTNGSKETGQIIFKD